MTQVKYWRQDYVLNGEMINIHSLFDKVDAKRNIIDSIIVFGTMESGAVSS